MTEAIIRPTLEKKAYRLRCRFAIDAAPQHPHWRALWERELEKAKYKAADQFVQDMGKEGWQYEGRFPWRFRGPFQPFPLITLPKRSQQKRWHIPSWELIPALMAGYRPDLERRVDESFIQTIPLLEESDKWEYELSAVFTRSALSLEVPDKQEEKETMIL